MCTTICSRYTENNISGQGYWKDVWEPIDNRNANEQLAFRLAVSVSLTALFMIHNVHDEVMDISKGFTWYQRVGCVLALNLASVFVVPIAIIESIVRIVIHFPISILMSLYNGSKDSVELGFGGSVFSLLCIVHPLITMYQLTTNTNRIKFITEMITCGGS